MSAESGAGNERSRQVSVVQYSFRALLEHRNCCSIGKRMIGSFARECACLAQSSHSCARLGVYAAPTLVLRPYRPYLSTTASQMWSATVTIRALARS